MSIHRLPLFRTARKLNRGGFTLVELLVVIGIIAILAGVALGPITRGIKQAQQSGGVQTTRTLALSEFQYANDNNQSYPFGKDASDIAKLLIGGNYISDPGIFFIGGSIETKFAGAAAATTIAKNNISYDFVESSATAGLNSNSPDQLPVIYSSVGTDHVFPTAPGADSIQLTTSNPFGLEGIAVCFKSNSSKFIKAETAAAGTAGKTPICDGSFPGATAISAVGGG